MLDFFVVTIKKISVQSKTALLIAVSTGLLVNLTYDRVAGWILLVASLFYIVVWFLLFRLLLVFFISRYKKNLFSGRQGKKPSKELASHFTETFSIALILCTFLGVAIYLQKVDYLILFSLLIILYSLILLKRQRHIVVIVFCFFLTFTFLFIARVSYSGFVYLASYLDFAIKKQRLKEDQAVWKKSGDTWIFHHADSAKKIRINLSQIRSEASNEQIEFFFHPKPNFYYGYPNFGIPFFAISTDPIDSVSPFPSLAAFLSSSIDSETIKKEITQSLAIRENSQEISLVKVYESTAYPLAQQLSTIVPIIVEYQDNVLKQQVKMIVFVGSELSRPFNASQLFVIFVGYQQDFYGNKIHPFLATILNNIQYD